MRKSVLAVVTAMLMVVVAGCGLVSSSGTFREAFLTDGSTPLEGTKVRVTSKNFTESVLLGKITATYLGAAGAAVEDLTNAPGSMSSRQALLNGDADILWEYTGTAWQTYLGETETISDPNELWKRVRDADRANGAEWLPPASFNNTYAFAASAPTAKRLDVKTMSDITKLPVSERTFCINDEFLSRADGMIPMLKAYDMPLGTPNGVPKNNVTTMDSGVVYTSTAKSEPCNFGMVYSTDGRIKNLDLTVLEDDRKFFLPYSGCVVVSTKLNEQAPEIAELMAPVSTKLTDSVMQELNGRIDIDGEDPADVAYDWLKEEGFIA
ncbi:glycine betaine ABC transporter substrate-binding protein [Gordonia metallireducens]|uniref:glycine betaine ABC transporter substrate-binding protein n=1 Tax=Gordonia metallireducens TaxID=2897779 RepID=UPI001E610EA3|nr:glycine betaine ABC transporter substrate-binding protein [Gordonia metallireducens]